jgi:hypothetical protein
VAEATIVPKQVKKRGTRISLAGSPEMVPMGKRIVLVSLDDHLFIRQRGLVEQQGYAVTRRYALQKPR